jgi:2-polyprenyl-3-methyl-5-hydroxy-6-metoxy-1,4-benzoquinol methylase
MSTMHGPSADGWAQDDLDALYGQRFDADQYRRKRAIWRELGRHLQRYLPADAAVLDLASDGGHFLAGITAATKVAVDIRDTSAAMPPDVHFIQSDSLRLREAMPVGSFDVVFVSNFLEHLPSRQAVVDQMRVAFDLLRLGGRVVVIQPNVRLTGGAYWDFIDHTTPLTERSVTEAAEMAGFRTHTVVTRFLPYTTKGRMPKHAWLVRLYLRCRPAWLLMGKQSLYVGEKA